MLTAPSLNRLYITRQARQVIEEEALRHTDTSGSGHETGGILIGRRLPDQPDAILIVVATGPGEHAVRTPTEFSPDIGYVNEQLKIYRSIYPRIDYIGTWHKHPPGYSIYSPGDLVTARAIFRDPSYAVGELVSPIVVVEKGRPIIRYYYMSREMATARADFALVDDEVVQLLDESDHMVQRERADYRSTTEELQPLWVNEEYARLQARDYQVRLRRGRQRQDFFISATDPTLPDVMVHFAVPNDYPASPPQIFVERAGKEVAVNSEKLYETLRRKRNGDVYLVDVVDEVANHLKKRSTGQIQRPAAGSATPAEGTGQLVAPSATPGRIVAAADPVVTAPKRPAATPVLVPTAPPPEVRPADDEERELGRRPARPLWPWVGAVAAALTVIFLLFLALSRGDDSGYVAAWQQIDRSLTPPSLSSLQTAIPQLEQIRSADPAGALYSRNREVTTTLLSAYTTLGAQLLALQPPDLPGAESAYRSALALDNQFRAAVDGQSRVQASMSATAEAQARQADLARRWGQVDQEQSPRLRVSLIEALIVDGATADLSGTPAATRLHEARLAYIAALTAQGDYALARAVAAQARAEAPGDAALQEAIDILAQALLAEAEGQNGSVALGIVNELLQLSPPPSAELLDTARSRQDLLNQQVDAIGAISQGWIDYDRALAVDNLDGAVRALDVVRGLTNDPLPDPARFADQRYDPRTPQVGLFQVDARLRYAAALQRAGDEAAAEAQYQSIDGTLSLMEQSGRSVEQVGLLRQRYADQQAEFARAKELWAAFNSARQAGRWRAALNALNELADLPGFGPAALRPASQETVRALQAEMSRRLTPTAAPTAPPSATAAPSPAPSETPAPAPSETPAPAPSETPAPAPSETPQAEQSPVTTATP